MAERVLDTALGRVRIVAGPAGLSAVRFVDADGDRSPPNPAERALEDAGAAVAAEAAAELSAWLSGQGGSLDALPVAARGTPFQRAVWHALRTVPSGTTVTYGGLAERVGRPRAARAVAGACARNPVAVVVPCHRVVASDGSLGGYTGGRWRKRALLALEGGLAEDAPGRGSGEPAG